MNVNLQNTGYLFVDNFISASEVDQFSKDFKDAYRKCPENFLMQDPARPNTPSRYDFLPFTELLVKKIPFISEIVEEDVFPTYCYARDYRFGDKLNKHVDRPACEISVTIHLSSDKPDWGIFFEKPNKEIYEAILKPGQAIIYLGCAIPHWREEFKGQSYQQMFLHYVRTRGENNWTYFDKLWSKNES